MRLAMSKIVTLYNIILLSRQMYSQLGIHYQNSYAYTYAYRVQFAY